MYESYFGLTERPFSIAPDPQYLYMSSRHKEAMGHLSYGLSQGGCFVVLTGEVGTGKTTLCRNLLGDLPDDVDVALILNASINEQELLQNICDEFGIDYSQDTTQKQLLDNINRYLLETFSESRHAVLIIDEAQLLRRDVLEQIRLLTNLETTKSKLLQIILIGQPELNEALGRNDLRQLAQRVTARYHLGAIQKSEIEDYVNCRLSVAGGKKPLFSRQALNKLYRLTDGIPRKINVLADHSLLAAYSKGASSVDAKAVKSAASDVFIKSGPSAKTEKKKSRWLTIVAIAVFFMLLNIALWWFFSQPRIDLRSWLPSKWAVQQDDQPTKSVPTGVPSAATSLGTLIAEAPTDVSATEPIVSQAQLSQQVEAEQTVSISTSASIPPSKPSSALSSGASSSTGEAADPGYFSRILETSADLTGPVKAFRELANIWGESLPEKLINAPCNVLIAQGLRCLYQTDWNKMLNFNRPVVLVVNHQGQLHRVILKKVNGDVAQLLVGSKMFSMDLAELQSWWFGEAVLLWRPSALGSSVLQLGSRGKDVVTARAQLNKTLKIIRMPTLQSAKSSTYDSDMEKKVYALQARFGITPDSKMGKETSLLMNEIIESTSTPILRNRLR